MGPIVDLSFAHIKKEVVLGCVDDAGNLFVYRILEQSAGKSSVVDLDWIRSMGSIIHGSGSRTRRASF
jgi:hypothetical protein